MKFIYALLISIAITCSLLYMLSTVNPAVFSKEDSSYNLVYASLFTIFAICGVLTNGRIAALKNLSQFAVWVVLIFIMVGLYGFRFQLENFYNVAMLNLMPSRVSIAQDGSVQIAKSNNGHYMVTANVNNVPIYFLIDTGATDVSLTMNDAKKIGIDTSNLVFNQATNTANGINYAAQIVISSIKIGNIEISRIKGNVIREGLDTSLLGMSFLNKLTSYSFQNDILSMEKK